MQKSFFEITRSNFVIRGTKYVEENTNGVPLIISHGFMSSSKRLKHYAEGLASKGYIVYAFDFCGGATRGKSTGKPCDMDLETEYEDLKCVVKYAKERSSFGKVILVGESQGGLISLMYASRHNDDVYACSLIYPALCIPSDARRGKMLWMSFDPEDIDNTFKPKLIKLSTSYPKSALKLELDEIIKAVECPIFIVHGKEDKIVDIKYTKRAIDLANNNMSKYEEVDGGHGFSFEVASKAIEDINLYLSRLLDTKRIVDKHDYDFISLFATKSNFSLSLDKYEDQELLDKYDHNYFDCKRVPSIKEMEDAFAFQKNDGKNYIKFMSSYRFPKELVDRFKLEEGEVYSMVFLKYVDSSSFRNNGTLIIKEHTLNNDLSKDIIQIEKDYYSELYGEDFTIRNIKRTLQIVEKQVGVHYICAYLDDKCVGAMYYFQNENATVMDSLIVRQEARNKFVATSMIKYVVDHSIHNTYLHADADDTPKEIYKKLGFSNVSTVYEYFKEI